MILYLRGGGMLLKTFFFLLDVTQNSMASTQIVAKIYTAQLKECAYHKIQQYFAKK